MCYNLLSLFHLKHEFLKTFHAHLLPYADSPIVGSLIRLFLQGIFRKPLRQVKQNLTKMIHIKKYHLNLQWLHPSQMDVVTKNINSENGKNAFVLSLN